MRRKTFAVVFGALLLLSSIPVGGATGGETVSTEAQTNTVQTDVETGNYTYRVPFSLNEQKLSSAWGSKFVVRAQSPQTVVSVDTNADGTFEKSVTLDQDETTSVETPSKGAAITSTAPVTVRYRYGSANFGAYEDGRMTYGLLNDRQAGTEYYSPIDAEALWVTPTTDTEIQVDADADGTYETTRSVASGEVISVADVARGAHLSAENTIHVVAKQSRWSNLDNTYTTTLLPVSQAQTSYEIPGEPSYNAQNPTSKSGVYLTATEDGTEVTVERTDGTGTQTATLDTGGTEKFEIAQNGTVAASAPVSAVYTYHVSAGDWWGSATREFVGATQPVGPREEVLVRQAKWGGKHWDGGLHIWNSYQAVETGDNPVVSVEPQSVMEDEPATANVTLSEAPNGLQTFEVTVTLDNTSVATVDNVSAGAVGGNAFEVVEQTDETVTFRAADFADSVQPGDESVVLGEIAFTDTTGGESGLSVSVDDLTGENGSAVPAEIRSSPLVVETHPFDTGLPGVGDRRPTDPDGDGLYEDIDGDGEVTFGDATDLAFAETDGLTDRQIAALDFDGDGDLDFDDAVELAFSV